MVNTPIPASLKSEAKKAAKILREFTGDSGSLGLDTTIPGWSAPSAIGIAGLGGGFEVGAEVTDFVIILNSQSAVDAFSQGGNLTLGGNFTVAAGPLGRNLEGDVAVKGHAAIYTYSRTRGLFAGISLEGSYLIERKDTNTKFYGDEVRAVELLSGSVPPPDDCSVLYEDQALWELNLSMVIDLNRNQYCALYIPDALIYVSPTFVRLDHSKVLRDREQAAQKVLMDKAKHEGVKHAQKKMGERGLKAGFLDRFDPKGKAKHEGVKHAQKKMGERGLKAGFLDRFYPKAASERPKQRRNSDNPPPPGDSRKYSAPSVPTFKKPSAPSFLKFKNSSDSKSSETAPKRPPPRPPGGARSNYGATDSTPWSTSKNVETRNLDPWKESPRRGSWSAGKSSSDVKSETWKSSWDSGYHGDDTTTPTEECFTPVSEVAWSTRGAACRPAEFCVRCMYSFSAQMQCDLTFRTGDVIEVLTHTDSWEDWWEGRLNGHVGLFPANFTQTT